MPGPEEQEKKQGSKQGSGAATVGGQAVSR